MNDRTRLICCKCDTALVTAKTTFKYMSFTFNADLPRCPKCGQVFITEELVKGRMSVVEMELEEK